MTTAVDLGVENQTKPQKTCTKRKNGHFQDSKIVLKAYEASEIVAAEPHARIQRGAGDPDPPSPPEKS